MEEYRNGKIERILGIYTKLINGYLVVKSEEARRYKVNERTIQRDIDDIRNFFETEAEHSGFINSVNYDYMKKGYHLEQIQKAQMTNGQVLALCKILLDSRAFTKKEMQDMLDRLIACCVPKSNQKLVADLVGNEAFHYVAPRHGISFMDLMWQMTRFPRFTA